MSDAECDALVAEALAASLDDDSARPSTAGGNDGKGDASASASAPAPRLGASGTPAVQLDRTKLWPLAPLVLAAAGPSAWRAAAAGDDVLAACVGPWCGAASVAGALAWAVPRLVGATTPAPRTSESASLSDASATAFLLARCEALLGCPADTFEAPVATRYTRGQRFVAHNDASLAPERDWGELGGQRLVTVLTYLNDVERGGRTVFPRLREGTTTTTAATTTTTTGGSGLAVTPRKGTALVFFPADVDGRADERTEHYAEEAVDEKWVCQLWKRQRTVPPPLGPSLPPNWPLPSPRSP